MSETIDMRDARGRPALKPQEMVEKLRQADFGDAFREIVTVLETDHRERFEADVSPEGMPWPALSPYTIAKKGHDTKLEEIGFLRGSETDSGSPLAIRDVEDSGEEKSLKFGTRRKFARVHQEGTERIPQRKHLGASQNARAEIARIIRQRVAAVLTEAR